MSSAADVAAKGILGHSAPAAPATLIAGGEGDVISNGQVSETPVGVSVEIAPAVQVSVTVEITPVEVDLGDEADTDAEEEAELNISTDNYDLEDEVNALIPPPAGTATAGLSEKETLIWPDKPSILFPDGAVSAEEELIPPEEQPQLDPMASLPIKDEPMDFYTVFPDEPVKDVNEADLEAVEAEDDAANDLVSAEEEVVFPDEQQPVVSVPTEHGIIDAHSVIEDTSTADTGNAVDEVAADASDVADQLPEESFPIEHGAVDLHSVIEDAPTDSAADAAEVADQQPMQEEHEDVPDVPADENVDNLQPEQEEQPNQPPTLIHDDHEDDGVAQDQEFKHPKEPLVLDVPPPPPAPTIKYEIVDADELAKEFSIVTEDCGDGWASNDLDGTEEGEEADAVENDSVHGVDGDSSPCVRKEATFIGCADANISLPNTANNGGDDGSLLKGIVYYDYDLYLNQGIEVASAVRELEESMLAYIAAGVDFEQCGGFSTNGRRTLLLERSLEQESSAEAEAEADAPELSSIVGMSSKPSDKSAAYETCTSTQTYDVPSQCVPMNGRMTYYISGDDDAKETEEFIIKLVEKGARNGNFVSRQSPSGTNPGEFGGSNENILGVAFVENRALESARLPGSNPEQFTAVGGISGVAIGMISFVSVLACTVVGAAAARRSKNRSTDDPDPKDGSFPTVATAPVGRSQSFDMMELGASVLADFGAPGPAPKSVYDIDVEKQQQLLRNDDEDSTDERIGPVPTVTRTLSSISELFSNGSMDFGDVSLEVSKVSGDASTGNSTGSDPHVQLVMMNDAVHTVPLPTGTDGSILSPEATDGTSNTAWAAAGRTAVLMAGQPGEGSEADETSSVGSHGIALKGSTDFGVAVPSPPSKKNTRSSGTADVDDDANNRKSWEEQDNSTEEEMAHDVVW